MLVVNLFGGPGSGKSALSFLLGGLLKTQHPDLCTEVPNETAKLLVYDEAHKAFGCQLYIAGLQQWQIARCEGHADVVVCDSPVMLSMVYGNEYGQHIPEEFGAVLKFYHSKFPSLNYLVKRQHAYDPRARLQTETEAERIGRKIETMLSIYDIRTKQVSSTTGDANLIVRDIVARINDTNQHPN